MRFADRVLVRLADPAQRGTLFDDDAVQAVVAAGFDTELMPVSPPFDAIFDELTFGFHVAPRTDVRGDVLADNGTSRHEVRLTLSGLAQQRPVAVDALWVGSVVVRMRPPLDRVEQIDLGITLFDVDDAIAGRLGELPADPDTLESERRTEVLTRLRAGLSQPAALADVHLDRLLLGAGVATVGELVTDLDRQLVGASAAVRYSAPSNIAESPRSLPVTAAVLVRDADLDISATLADSKAIVTQLDDLGLVRPTEPGIRRRRPVLIVWIVPVALFDDTDWPGAQRLDRITNARRWLAAEGIALMTVT